jgi:UDP-N-acetylmuramate--alanine ligase
METALGRPLAGRRVHFVGIGGVGMAALAELLLAMGYEISGSDLKESRVVRRLVSLGMAVSVGPHRAGAADGADHVIVNAAIPAGSPDVVHARERGQDVTSRAELLGRIFDAGRGLAVTGTHGKTSTSSMLARALDGAGFSPSFIIGGDLNDVGSGARLGTSDLVVAEADEAYGSFLALRSELALVTNIDTDHLDYYEDQDAIDDAFRTFLDRRRDAGTAVVCADDAGVRRILARIRQPVVTYGLTGEDLRAEPAERGFMLRWRGTLLGLLRLPVLLRHHLLNASGAVASAIVLGADPAAVLEALTSFGGVDRRFSLRGERAGIKVIDDYAHHPREVAATLAAARETYPGARIVALFQPHLYSRTLQLAEQFGMSFDDADVVVVTDVYGAREDPMPGVSGRLVSDAIRIASSGRVIAAYIPRLDDAAGFVAGYAERGDIIVTMGAGDVTTAAPRILELIGGAGS